MRRWHHRTVPSRRPTHSPSDFSFGAPPELDRAALPSILSTTSQATPLDLRESLDPRVSPVRRCGVPSARTADFYVLTFSLLTLQMERLWSPWRLAYVTSTTSKPDACIFCDVTSPGNGAPGDPDRDQLVLVHGRD